MEQSLMENIEFKGHRFINGGYGKNGLVLEFVINGIKFTRLCDADTKQVYFWKQNDERYPTEQEAFELEGIIKNYIKGSEFKEQVLIDLF